MDDAADVPLLPLARPSQDLVAEHEEACYMCVVGSVWCERVDKSNTQSVARHNFFEELRRLCRADNVDLDSLCLRIQVLHRTVILPAETQWYNAFLADPGSVEYPEVQEGIHEKLVRPWSLQSIREHVRMHGTNLVKYEAAREIGRISDTIEVQSNTMLRNTGELDGDAVDRLCKLQDQKRKWIELYLRVTSKK